MRETLWDHYDTLLSSYNYYLSLGGVCGEPDGPSYQLSRYRAKRCNSSSALVLGFRYGANPLGYPHKFTDAAYMISPQAAIEDIRTLCLTRCLFSIRIYHREQYNLFLSDVLGSREKENKALEHELQRIFMAVNVEEDSTSQEGQANLKISLCEQVGDQTMQLKGWSATRDALFTIIVVVVKARRSLRQNKLRTSPKLQTARTTAAFF